jgi:hypothetical protein
MSDQRAAQSSISIPVRFSSNLPWWLQGPTFRDVHNQHLFQVVRPQLAVCGIPET